MNSQNLKCLRAGLLTALVLGLLAAAAPAQAGFSLINTWVSANASDGTFSRQAGAHPDLQTHIEFSHNQATNLLDGNVKDVRVDLPPGVVGDPNATPKCALPLLVPVENTVAPRCPPETQIGVGFVSEAPGVLSKVPIYNMEHSDDVPGIFGFNYIGVGVFIQPQVRPTDYGVSALSARISQVHTVFGADITIWGVPADPSHDTQRTDTTHQLDDSTQCQFFGGPCLVRSTAPRKPFFSNPTSCADTPSSTTIIADSWQNPDVFDSVSFTADVDGTPFITDGCDRLAFDPDVSVRPLSHVADAPTGLAVDISIPQNQSPDGLATAHAKRVEVTFPQGMSVSPSSAAGLGACSPSQVGIGNDQEATCPDTSRLGSIKIETPLLDNPVTGDVFLAKQDDNPFHSLLAMYIVAKGPGFILKLPGKIDADETTGRLVATFDNNPQLPFSKLSLNFRGGSQAALANPPTCGTYNTHIALVSWASSKTVGIDSPMTIDEGCDERTFSPSVSAGTTNPAGGADSPFTLTVTRADRTQYLSRIGTTLPAGLLARLGSVEQCGEDQANAGTCGAASQVGSVSTLAGPGAQPLPVNGRVYLTGPYHGAPFGLSIVVPTVGQAGPFDLGNVVVRATIKVDRTTAQATVESDPLPSIIRGFPLRIRQARVTIDRPNFTFNPTSCAPKVITAGLSSLEGASTTLTVPFQALGCSDLAVDPKLSLRFTGKTATTDGTHPGIVAKLTDKPGGANIEKGVVKLPLSVALDPDNAQALCTPAQRDALACPPASIVGTAKALSVLPHPLTGPVYFVQGLRKSKTGATVRTLPKLWIPLSGDGVTVDVNASSDVDVLNRLVTTFDDLPDAPISEFDLSITGGKHGIIVVSGKPGTCDRDKTVESQFTGQNGKVHESGTAATIEGCKTKVKKSKSSSRAVTLLVSGLGAGKLTISGSGVSKATRTIKSADEASISARLTAVTRKALQRRGTVKVTVAVRFQPKSGKATTLKKTLTVKR
jgi:hypothetical protein